MNIEPLLEDIAALGQPKVLVIGDLILDEYVHGEIERISREAPVPIVIEKSKEFKPGGAANTIVNLASLGADVSAMGVIGRDSSGQNLLGLLNDCGVDTEFVLEDSQVPTTTKTRISAQSRQSVKQQVMRIDRLPEQALSPETFAVFERTLNETLPKIDILVVSDYGNGVVVPQMIQAIQVACKAHKTPWIVDSQEDLSLFKEASLLTPNKPEAEQNLGYLINTPEQLQSAGATLLEKTQAKALLITRGDEGMSLFEANGNYSEVPALNRSEVFDVTGAGDTVVASLAVALGSGLSYSSAMVLANLAASIVVRRHGCCTTTPHEMKQTLLAMKDN